MNVKPIALLMLLLSAVSLAGLLSMLSRLPEAAAAGTDMGPALVLAGTTTLLCLLGSLVAQIQK